MDINLSRMSWRPSPIILHTGWPCVRQNGRRLCSRLLGPLRRGHRKGGPESQLHRTRGPARPDVRDRTTEAMARFSPAAALPVEMKPPGQTRDGRPSAAHTIKPATACTNKVARTEGGEDRPCADKKSATSTAESPPSPAPVRLTRCAPASAKGRQRLQKASRNPPQILGETRPWPMLLQWPE